MFFNPLQQELTAARMLAKADGALAASHAGGAFLVKLTPPPPDSSCPKPHFTEPCAHLLREVTA